MAKRIKALSDVETFDAFAAIPALLDALLEGRSLDDKREADLVRLRGITLVLAQHIYRLSVSRMPKTRGTTATWHTVAIREAKIGGWSRIIEWDYRCLYCGESLATLAPGGGRLPLELDRHGIECAYRFLMEFPIPARRTRTVIAKFLRSARSKPK